MMDNTIRSKRGVGHSKGHNNYVQNILDTRYETKVLNTSAKQTVKFR